MEHKSQLKHKLLSRHLQMIAIGGVIGTGLFFGSAKSIHLTGPSIVLSYLLGGLIMYIIMRALGEITLIHPSSGSFSEYAYKYLGKYAGFISGWSAWFEYTVVCMVELTAVAFFLSYWYPGIPHWLVCLIVLVLFTSVNLISIKSFGEFEFYFAGIKVVAILAMIIFSAYLLFFKGALNPDINHYTAIATFFAGGWHGFAISLVLVIFSFGGVEFVCIAAGEVESPNKNIPRAINGVIIRILLFYILTMVVIICLYPYNKLDTNVSPFVDVFQKIGIPLAAGVMNVVAITAALSAFNSCLYSGSRMLYNLSLQGNMVASCSKTTPKGIPFVAVLFTMTAILIAVIMNFLFPDKAIMYLLIIATCAILITWFMILITHIKFRSLNKQHVSKFKFKQHLYPYSNYFAILMLCIVMVIMTQMNDMRLSVYIAPFWLLVLSLFYLVYKRKKSG